MCKSVNLHIWFLIALILEISSCAEVKGDIDETNFAPLKPFGLNWNVTDKYKSADLGKCDKLVESLSILINPQQKGAALLECKREEYSTVFLNNQEIPKGFQKGEISILLQGGKLPVAFTYSYLHDWSLEDLSQKRELREAHAAEIKSQLVNLFGLPSSNGHFDQGSQFGFIVDNEITQPCSFWLISDIGVLLCSERVVMIDGTEMSLSFTNYAEDVVGRDVHNIALVKSGKKPKPINNNGNLPQSSRYSKANLNKLYETVFPNEAFGCSKNNLKPIKPIWAEARNYNSKLQDIYNSYSGEELAQYVFEYSIDFDKLLPSIEKDLAVMLLLKRAAEQGSASAMNEIGVSLLYCYNNLEQDIMLSIDWLEKAASGGDTLAMQTLASMYLAELIDSQSPKSKSLALLKRCSKLEKVCEEKYEVLNLFLNSPD